MKQTLVDLLEKYKEEKNISFAMPGHKGGKYIDKRLKENFFEFDVTELEQTENLHVPKNLLKKSLRDTADFLGAEESYILVNGSTSGIFTMLMACCKQGDSVIINRGAHVAAINACIALGIEPIFINERIIDDFYVSSACYYDEIERLLKKNKCAAVFVTSPTYYGFTADLNKISKLVHSYGIPLLVDEAHGVHFAASEKIFPKSAMKSGADICVQSAHKTLNSANQTAFLHVRGNMVDRRRLKKCYSIFQTTSPSYPLIASAELARIELELSGKKDWERVHNKCKALREKLKECVISPDRSMREKYGFYDIDECRLVINASKCGLSGFEFSKILREKYKIDVEMADAFQIILIPTPANSDDDFETLELALSEILKGTYKGLKKNCSFKLPKHIYKMTMQEAFNEKGKLKDYSKCVGEISKGIVVPYPPGIAVLVPGEIITDEIILFLSDLIEMGAEVHGVENGRLEIIT